MVENKYKEFVDKAVRNFHEAIERRTTSINKRGKIRFKDESAVNIYTELKLQILCDKPLQQLPGTVKENATLEKDFVSRLTYFYNSLYLFRGTSRTFVESTKMCYNCSKLAEAYCEMACVRSNRGVKHIGANSKWKVTEAFNSTATKIQEHYATVKESDFESGNNCIEDKSGENNATMVVELGSSMKGLSRTMNNAINIFHALASEKDASQLSAAYEIFKQYLNDIHDYINNEIDTK